ncbi:helix-turn-helix domain-containing protein [Pseudomonas sp. S2_H01]
MLALNFASPVVAQNGGYFISRGIGRHPRRIIDSYELIYVDKGSRALREQNEEFVLSEGETLVLQPGQLHEGITDYDPTLRFYWLHFELAQPTTPGSESFVVRRRTAVTEPERFVALLRLFLGEQEDGAPPETLGLLVLLMLQKLSRHKEESGTAGRGVALAYRAKQEIGIGFGNELSASSIAERLRCNADYLGRVFRQAFGINITEAIHRQRVTAAERMLLRNDSTIAVIAQLCGFKDSAYMRRIFIRKVGMTPAAYRRLYCKEHVNVE